MYNFSIQLDDNSTYFHYGISNIELKDGFFGLLQDCLTLYETQMLDNAYSFCHYLKLFGISNEKIQTLKYTSYNDILDTDYNIPKEENKVKTL